MTTEIVTQEASRMDAKTREQIEKLQEDLKQIDSQIKIAEAQAQFARQAENRVGALQFERFHVVQNITRLIEGKPLLRWKDESRDYHESDDVPAHH